MVMVDMGIVVDRRVLTEEFIPKEMVHRLPELNVMRDNLKSALEGREPKDMLLFGLPGTGKTSSARYILEELLMRTSRVITAYVNCWTFYSRFKILYSVLEQLGPLLTLHFKGTATSELLERIAGRAKDKQIVVVLDEVDQLEEEAVLYDLLGVPNLSLIMITNKGTALYDLDARIQSRLSYLDTIEFKRYAQEQIVDILKDRVKWGLVPGSISIKQLGMLAKHAGGDARIAINSLRLACDYAENDEADQVENEHVILAVKSARTFVRQKNLSRLNKHQRILYEIIRDKKRVKAEELYTLYKARAKEPMVERTLRKYLAKMAHYNIVKKEGDARGRVYSLV